MAPTIAALAPFAQAGLHFDPVPHRYTLNGRQLPSVTQILRAHRQTRLFDGVPTGVLENKLDIGIGLHQATVYDDLGRAMLTITPAVAGYLEGWRQFKAVSGYVPLLIETPLAHPTRGFAGTVDRLAFVPLLSREKDAPAIIDIKTGDPADAAAHVQTAAYEWLVRANYDDIYAWLKAQGRPLPPDDDMAELKWPRYSVQLFADGRFKLHPYPTLSIKADRGNFEVVLAATHSEHPSWRDVRG